MTGSAVDSAAALAEVARAALSSEGDAIRFEGEWIGWSEVRAIAKSVTDCLEKTGISAGAPIAFAPRNSPQSLAAFPALLDQQRCIRMVYPFQRPEALAKSLAKLSVAAVVMDAQDFTPPVVEALSAAGVAGIALERDGARVVEGLERATARAADEEARLEVLTSGTTGTPKHFPIPCRVVLGYVKVAEGMAVAKMGGAPMLLCFPLSNISGLYSVASSFLRGEKVILLERFSVAAWRDYIVEYRPVASGGPPASLAMILADDIPREDLSSLKAFSTGAAPLDPEVQRRFEEHYGIMVVQSYGATEFGGPVVLMTAEMRAEGGPERMASVGKPFGGSKIRIRDPETGELAAPGEVGVLEVVSPRMGDDWIVTSDLGLIDDDGFVFLRGRADGAIMRGGFKIVPELVEEALLKHPDIKAASVVGLPDDRLLEVPGAAIETRPGVAPPSDADLSEHIRQHLPSTHVPAAWLIVDELPRTVSFKVDRNAVKELFASQSAALAG